MGDNHKTYLYEISCRNQPTITLICKHQPIGDNNPLCCFIGNNPQLTQSPLFLCRHQPKRDTNPLYYFLGINLYEASIPYVPLYSPTYFTQFYYFFTMFISQFYFHQLFLLPFPLLGLLVYYTFTKSILPLLGILLPKCVSFGFFHRTNLPTISCIQFWKFSFGISTIGSLRYLLCLLQI